MFLDWKALVIEPGIHPILNLMLAPISTKVNGSSCNKTQMDPKTAFTVGSSCEFILSSLYATNAAIFDQINADVLFRKVNYLYLATFMCPIVLLYPVST